ncbi:uncharacterized protein L201_002280 [Kwoniella dendrophila CBS 6074]|uniref:SGNH hydrolase-type esterase domain-containing protein n=1 Tax=Kwoniella dendrophila CBS 6074 TaxID=1295534 RepID=A0AAX4JPR1_9TREE
MARPIQDAIMLMGDSITSRQDVPLSINALFSETYRRTLDVLNRGLGAYNTRFYLPLLDEFLLRRNEIQSINSSTIQSQKIKLVTIWFGANDSVLKGFLQHVPLEEYIENLNSILNKLTGSDSEYDSYEISDGNSSGPLNIVLITPPPILPSMMGGFDFSGQRELENTRKYAKAVLDIGKEWKGREIKMKTSHWKIRTIDLFNGILNDAGGQADELKPYFTDGLHLSTKGYDIMWKQMINILENDFKDRGISPSELQESEFTIPDWNTLDHSNPNSAVEKMKGPYKRT